MTTTDIAIKTENISKCYRIGLKENIHDSLGTAAIELLKSPLKNYRRYRSLYTFDDINFNSDPDSAADTSDIIWSLRDVSFEIKRGEALGIIGRNGAGKSTLLKILSRITDPTTGRAEIRGRVSSLLEVGTGFHPELTGRENVYLNGIILGMRKKEVDRKFDQIVEFSEVGKFINTPVKRYSSGMRVRLAFSVAAHLDPEILIVDEVLAVGDAAFQKKCLGTMEGVAKGGRTVLFVSHNMGMISELCSQCMLLTAGRLTELGETKSVVSRYVSEDHTSGWVDLRNWSKERINRGTMRILHLSTDDRDGEIRSQFAYGEPVVFKIGVSGTAGSEIVLGVSIRNTLGQLILHFSNLDDSTVLILPEDKSEIHMCLGENILNDGTYYITVFLGDGFNILHDRVGNCLLFTVESSMQGRIVCKAPVRYPATWKMRELSNASKEPPKIFSSFTATMHES